MRHPSPGSLDLRLLAGQPCLPGLSGEATDGTDPMYITAFTGDLGFSISLLTEMDRIGTDMDATSFNCIIGTSDSTLANR